MRLYFLQNRNKDALVLCAEVHHGPSLFEFLVNVSFGNGSGGKKKIYFCNVRSQHVRMLLSARSYTKKS